MLVLAVVLLAIAAWMQGRHMRLLQARMDAIADLAAKTADLAHTVTEGYSGLLQKHIQATGDALAGLQRQIDILTGTDDMEF